MNLSPETRIAGILAPLFALRRENDLGIGDVGALREFVDWVSESGFKLVQLLPINEIGGDNSPYNAISAMAIEPTTLDLTPSRLEDLRDEDVNAIETQVNEWNLRHGAVKYEKVKGLKQALLRRAFFRFEQRPADDERRHAFNEFCKQQEEWLADYTLFRWLMDANGGTEKWDSWSAEHQTVESTIAWLNKQDAKLHEAVVQRRAFYAYVQWVGQQQWREIREYANSRGVALMGDIPFGISYYSADVFARRGEFALDWCGGAPPEPYFKDDAFTQKWGQNWGIPLYQWPIMRGNNLAWWRQRVRGVREIFDIFRIDHVMGFYRIYAFPWRPTRNKEFLPLDWNEMLQRTDGQFPHFTPRDDSTPENCEANRREGEEYLRVVLAESGDTYVVGEDLGTVPDYIRPNLRSLGIAGFKIPQWEMRHERVTPGDEYERLSVATYATHDHKPIRAMWEEAVEEVTPTTEQARTDLNRIAQFSAFDPHGQPIDFEKDFYPAIMKALFASNAWIAVVMLTDLLARKYRFNVPGTAAKSNWTRRMQRSISHLRSSRKERARMQLIRGLLEKTGRGSVAQPSS